jgi:endonuclease/exonuclease/phosphatase family metal-dependent hydrolase
MEQKERKPFFRRFTKKFFLFVNIVVSIVFIISCYGAQLNPSTWWFMGILNLGMPILLLLMLIFVIFWILIKPKLTILPIITILICWPSIRHVIPFNFSGAFQKQKENGRLRVMSWNVEHFDIANNKKKPQVKEDMLSLINEYKPDVACFQEMVASDSPKAINYIADIQQKLKFAGYYYTYRKDADFDMQHHFGIIIFSRFPIINIKTIDEYPHDYNSRFQYVDILYYQDTVRVFNVHLQSLRLDEKNLQYIDNPTLKSDSSLTESKTIIKKLKVGFEKRGIQAKHVREQIDQSPHPVIVCGDFNDVPNSFAYETIGDKLQNAFVEKGDGLGRTFSSISPTLRIDHIFVDERFKVEQFTRIRKKLSAHYPIIADVVLRSSLE